MYHFSPWKYWLVAIVLLVGVVFALPNVFGEDEALQLARQDRVAMDAAGEKQVRDLLQAQNVAVKGSYLEGDRLVLRFDDVATQGKAREALTKDAIYSVALANAPRTPAWMRAVGLKPMSLGLDLRGGVHFMYEVDVAAAISQTLDRLERDVRATLRDKRIPYATVANDGGTLTVTLRAAEKLTDATDAIKKIEDGLIVTANDDTLSIAIALTPQNIKERQDAAIQQNVTTLRNRVNQLGVSEPIVARQGKDRIVVQLPGVKDPNEAKRILGSTATLEWHMVDQANDAYEAERSKRIPLGSKLYKMREDGTPILLKRELIVSGDQMTDARADFVQGEPAVSVKLDARGGDNMLKNTQQNLGKLMAVLFVEKKRLGPGERCTGLRVGTECTQEDVISAATIRGVFGPSFQITGLQAGEARELALLLRAGSLSTPIYEVEQRTVGPSLGADNIKKGTNALILGMLLTVAFMVIYYKAFGVIASVVLMANVVLLTALLSMLPTSLSLPGIAGVVLTVGMAVDANILIFERIREEIRLGNSPQAAINAGFDKAFSAIADSNVTTLIAGVVLFALGSGPVKGFAVVLTLGILTSMFTAIVGSRALIHLLWGRRARLERLSI